MVYEVRRDEYVISTDKSAIDIDAVHAFLSKRSYWAWGIGRDRVARAIDNSIPFGLYHRGSQIGFARVVTDHVTFAYLADVYVEETHRGLGLSKLLMEAVLSHPDLQSLKRWILGTKDAHELYAQFGFAPLASPERWMERTDLEVYAREDGAGQREARRQTR